MSLGQASPVPEGDEQLIAASLAGDADAFRKLVERHYQKVSTVITVGQTRWVGGVMPSLQAVKWHV